MPASKPFIQGYYLSPEINCKISVMEVMEVVVRLQSFSTLSDKFMKSGVPECRAYAGMHQVEDSMDRVGWDDPVEKYT